MRHNGRRSRRRRVISRKGTFTKLLFGWRLSPCFKTRRAAGRTGNAGKLYQFNLLSSMIHLVCQLVKHKVIADNKLGSLSQELERTQYVTAARGRQSSSAVALPGCPV